MALPKPLKYCFILLLTLFVIGVYLFGIEGRQMPKNGDENVYFQITRVTAEHQHWLPLQSNLEKMHNTKPPLLFWQGILSTDWGADWSLFSLRLPNVIYTLLMAALLCYGTAHLLLKNGKSFQTAYLMGAYAGLFFLSFWSTFKYGRPFLTSAPETFWSFLPLLMLLTVGRQAFDSRLALPLLIGFFWGLAFLTKSFILLVPAAASLSLIYLLHRQGQLIYFLKNDVYKLMIMSVFGLTVFSLWFMLDPHPAAIWQEFIVGENAGKVNLSHGFLGYLNSFVRGGDTILKYLLGFLSNTGLLILPVLGLIFHTIFYRRKRSFEENALWIWILVWFIFFALPTQRSERYLLPVMPAIAILLAFHFQKLSAVWFRLSHLISLVILILMVALNWILLDNIPSTLYYTVSSFFVLSLGVFVSVFGIVLTRLSRYLLPFSTLCCFAGLSCLLAPLNTSQFPPQRASFYQHHTFAAPCNFRASEEAYQFDFSGARMTGYHQEDPQPTLDALLKNNHFVIWQTALLDEAPHCENCTILGFRFELLGRQNEAQIQSLWRGNIIPNLLAREWLIQNTNSPLLTTHHVSDCDQ
jgi:4-amino-4-deoxy-L-arabinose transferase-like glycosyltransferase